LPRYEGRQQDEYDQAIAQRLLGHLQQLPLEQRWDSVLVDEAHTFFHDWFLCCVAALKDPENGDLMVVSDGNQSLYQRQQFTWKSVGIKAQGRSKKLTQNYRNTRQILIAAWKVVTKLGPDRREDTTFPTIAPTTAQRRGPTPTLHLAQSKPEQVTQLIHQAQKLCESGYSASDIGILYRRRYGQDVPLFNAMLEQMETLGLRPYWITRDQTTKRNYSAKQPGIRVLTTLSALGLEFKAVLLLWTEQFSDCCAQDSSIVALA
jgi:superfamily I DNA/RNA helicase